MSGQPTWVFDLAGASGQDTGGDPANEVVEGKIRTLTREAAQNSFDQWLVNNDPARVVFSLITLSGQAKADFLKAADWKALGAHIDASVAFGKSSSFAKQLKKARARVDADEDLLLLRIDDFNTNGLLGGEDEPGQNFKNLCKNKFVTPERAGRGGSYGLGKQVYHRFSSVSAVFYSSYVDGLVDQNPITGVRLFGRAELTSHTVAGDGYNPGGWFGHREVKKAGPRAESIWDADALSETLQVGRSKGEGRGTSILIIGFFEPDTETDAASDPLEVAKQIIAEAEKWFWPVLSAQPSPLSIEARVIKDGTLLHTLTADPHTKWAHFIRAYAEPVTGTKAEKAGEVAESKISFRIPQRTEDPKHQTFHTDLMLRVTREPEASAGVFDELGRVALVRGFGMVVKYFQPKQRPFTADPFCGVLKVGTALSKSNEDQSAEEFFRSSEPPLHDDWKHTDALRESYAPGSGTALRDLWAELSEKVQELCGLPQPKDDQGPKLLSKMLPFGSAPGDGVKKTIIVNKVNASLTPSGWEVAGSVINTKPDGKPWNASLHFYFRGEKGRGDALPFVSLNVTSGNVTSYGPKAWIEVPANKKEIEFNGVLDTLGLSRGELLRIKLAYEQ